MALPKQSPHAGATGAEGQARLLHVAIVMDGNGRWASNA